MWLLPLPLLILCLLPGAIATRTTVARIITTAWRLLVLLALRGATAIAIATAMAMKLQEMLCPLLPRLPLLCLLL